jgi:hypothetical protein
MRARIAWTLTACLLAACATVPAPTAVAPATAPNGFPADFYRAAAARGEPVFRLDPEHSLVVIRVYRAGALARFGHDHVVASRAVQGYALLSGAADARRADLYAPLATLSVDEPALRAQAGFDTQPSQQDIEGTRSNMLTKVLDAEHYPFVSLHVASVTGEAPEVRASAAITLRGRTYTTPVRIALDTPSPAQLYVRGRFSAKQTDFGIEPYALLGGALSVGDRMDIEFEIAATRVGVGGNG